METKQPLTLTQLENVRMQMRLSVMDPTFIEAISGRLYATDYYCECQGDCDCYAQLLAQIHEIYDTTLR